MTEMIPQVFAPMVLNNLLAVAKNGRKEIQLFEVAKGVSNSSIIGNILHTFETLATPRDG